METMKAILCPKYGAAEVLQIKQVNKLFLKKDEVLIKIYATSIPLIVCQLTKCDRQ
jgi:hypothetical protein